MKKDAIIIIGIVLLGVAMYGLTLRGAPGNPTADQFKNGLDQATKAFELSPERGRFVHVANMAENGVYNLSQKWANIAYPDVGVSSDGKYNSFFAPGVSYFALPFYLLGAHYGLGQVAAFAIESLVSIITLVFIYLIGRRIFELPRWASLFAVLTYGFASTSWSYAITLYQNAFTAMFIVTGFYAVWRFAHSDSRYRFLYASYVWLAYALAISVDYPNAVLMLPIMLYLAAKTFSQKKVDAGIAITVRWSAIATFVVFAFAMGLQFWHNATYYGGWSHLAGTLHNYTPASEQRPVISPAVGATASSTASVVATSTVSSQEKTATSFFHEKAMPQSFFVLLFSDERGLFYFSPIFLFAPLGIMYAFRKKQRDQTIYNVPAALILVNIFLYSAWGDPWGGWAFGPRYLIASMPWFALFVSVFLTTFTRTWAAFLARSAAFILFMYSLAISLLGVLTTNAIPPKAEAALLPIHEYNYFLNFDYLRAGKSSSFMYNTYLSHDLTLPGFFMLLYIILVLIALVTLCVTKKKHHA
ncbi:MAG: hypothetical protein RLZZ26_203 [Candidatus Parcubacteria bacterium]|jgi:hypothetical protein